MNYAKSLSDKAEKPTSKWLVALGLAVYCSLCWALVVSFGAVLIDQTRPRDVEVAQTPPGAPQNSAARR